MIDIQVVYDLLGCGEDTVVEFKTSRGGFPYSFWSSFSAFANTNGGVIVLGVNEKNKKAFVDGLTKGQVTALKKQFWDNANNRNKVSTPLLKNEEAHIEEIPGEGWVLVCEVPRARYDQKPVYLDGQPYGNTYKRRHEGDYHCTDDEVRQMFADANLKQSSHDAHILKGYSMDDIDLGTLHKYRKAYDLRHENHPWSALSDMEFLKKVEAWRKDRESGEEGFTVAGIMMFGKTQSVTDQSCMPWFFPDYREHMGEMSGERWSDRIYPDGTWEVNVYQYFTRVFQKLSLLLPKPFHLADDGVTRMEFTPAHTAVREALANALIHAQHNSMGNVVVDSWHNKIVISNPGNMLVSVSEFYEGQHSVCRNPLLQKMFVFVGVGEKAGSGADVIVKGWEDRKWMKPEIRQCEEPDRVEMVMEMVNEENRSMPEGKELARSWQGVGKELGVDFYVLESLADYCREARSLAEIAQYLGFADRYKMKKKYIDPLLGRYLEMTISDSPNHPNQRYVLTEEGRKVLEAD